MKNCLPVIFKLLSTGLLACAFVFTGKGQCSTSLQLYNRLLQIEQSAGSNAQKLNETKQLQQQFVKCGYITDSMYARLLHRLGFFQYKNHELNTAIGNTLHSIRINRTGKAGASLDFAVNSYSNLGLYFEELLFYHESLAYFDSTIMFASKVKTAAANNFLSLARLHRSNIFYQTGNYQEAINESTLGIAFATTTADDISLAQFYNERAQCYGKFRNDAAAKNDIEKAIKILKPLPAVEDIAADSYKILAAINDSAGFYAAAKINYQKTIALRIKFNDINMLATDMMDFATFLALKNKDKINALKYNEEALALSKSSNDPLLQTKILNNTGTFYKESNNFNEALLCYQKGLNTLIRDFDKTPVIANPTEKQISITANKLMLFSLLANKSEALLLLYQQNGNKGILEKSLETSLLTDRVIDEMRNNQNTEPSRLFWRNKTRNFYCTAISEAYALNDLNSLFYFIEKSRAVLLNDRLNELGAFAYLPNEEAAKERAQRLAIVSLQMELDKLNNFDKTYQAVQLKLLKAKEAFNNFTSTLEKKYPAYYNYKYKSVSVTVKQFQEVLSKNGACYLTYFETDSVIYALSITKNSIKANKINYPLFTADWNQFLSLCSNKQIQNSQYSEFALLANGFYKKLVEPMQLSKGRLIVSTDNHFIPFDVLTTDAGGKNFLLYDYFISYTYSVSYLLRSSDVVDRDGKSFLGIAPEQYSQGMQLNSLLGSVSSLEKIKKYYSGSQLLVNESATRKNFLTNLSDFKIIQVYSHAGINKERNEPEIFMQDAAVNLSELQLVNNPVTQLILLSACETNTGKQEKGEGVYSLARGFAAAGIPSTIATLWKADNEAMYAISEKFHFYLSKGLPKDEALQKARIDFIRNGRMEQQLPFYWGSSVLFGNTEKMKSKSSVFLYLLAGFAGLLILLIVYIKKNHPGKRVAQ